MSSVATRVKPKRVLVVFGTRPEAIKLTPVLRALRECSVFETKVCVTGQHRELLDQALSFFSITPDFDLRLMEHHQDLSKLTAKLVNGLGRIYEQCRPDIIVVQGDTTTTLAGSLAAFYANLPVAHVEAGLRTGDNFSPWPEEMNRRLTSVLATWHFAPTEGARANLIREGFDSARIIVTGNTGVDALKQTVARLASDQELAAELRRRFAFLDGSRRTLLVTSHRRENFRDGLGEICLAVEELTRRKDVQIVWPVHFNPTVAQTVQTHLRHCPGVFLTQPLPYAAFVYLAQLSHAILSDSGGVQEEAPYLGKPAVVVRDKTERTEGVDAGSLIVVSPRLREILSVVERLLDEQSFYSRFTRPRAPFGDGCAANRIVDFLCSAVESGHCPKDALIQ